MKVKQAVILAAGKSTRTYPLTLNKPKALLKVLGKTILEHNLDQLEGLVDEVLVVIGYKAEMIKTTIGNSYKGIKIKYIEQKNQTGTGSALLECKNRGSLEDRFLVLNGDDFFSRKDIENCLHHKYSVLASEVKDPQNFGIFGLKGNKVIGLEEKPKQPKSNLANTGLYVFDKEIFNFKLEQTERGEYEITDYLKYLIKNKEVVLEKVKDFWKPVVYSWSLFPVLETLLKKSSIKGEIDSKTEIQGKVYIGKNSILKVCKLSGFVNVGDGCVIENSEIKDCVIGDNCKIVESVLLDSVIGNSVELTDCKTKNKSEGKIEVRLNGKVVECKRGKLGVLIGDFVKAEGVVFNPGEAIEPNTIKKSNL